MSKQVTISNTTELLEFIKRENISVKQATEIVCKAIKVICIFELTKKELIRETEYFINNFYNNNNLERPIFLGQINLDPDASTN